MGVAPHGLTLERKNNLLGYFKENCIWASRIEQAKNRRSNIIVTVHGITACLKDHCMRLNINYKSVWKRIKDGWTTERALFTPIRE